MTQVISRNARVSYSSIYSEYGTAQEQIDRVTERIHTVDQRGWNSGALAPQWIQYDLNGNQNQRISRIRLRVDQYPEFAKSLHQILVGTCENDMTIVKEFNGFYGCGDWLSHTFDLPLENIRYVRIRTIKSGSWVAWLRILIDGPEITDQTQSQPVTEYAVSSLLQTLQAQIKIQELLAEEIRTNLLDLNRVLHSGDCSSMVYVLGELLTKIRPLNVPEIKRLVEKVKGAAVSIYEQDIILLVGPAGAGKSTTIQFLASANNEVVCIVPLPRGSIIIWYGAENTLPKGWAVCDGKKGTPDLRDRFVIGSGSGAHHAPDDTGGETTITPKITVQDHVLTIAEMPSHNHGGTTGIEDNGAIGYNMPVPDNIFVSINFKTGHWYNVQHVSKEKSLTHRHSIASEGQNQPHSHSATASEINLTPPFYALLYIMKL